MDTVLDQARLLKHDRTTTVGLLRDPESPWVIKRYNTKNLWHALRRPLRRSRAEICWQGAHHLIDIGIATPRPVMMLEETLGPLKGRSYFVTEFVDGEQLSDYLSGRDNAEVEAVAAQIGRLFRQLLAAGIAHGDMKASNLLVHRRQVYLLDLDAIHYPIDPHARVRALNRDRARFLRNWATDEALQTRFERMIAPLSEHQIEAGR